MARQFASFGTKSINGDYTGMSYSEVVDELESELGITLGENVRVLADNVSVELDDKVRASIKHIDVTAAVGRKA